jgi:hypothetical protein
MKEEGGFDTSVVMIGKLFQGYWSDFVIPHFVLKQTVSPMCSAT